MTQPVLTDLTEASPTATATPVDGQPGRFLIQLITPGWGTSGHYSEAVLQAAVRDRVWPAGTHMYIDHPTVSEEFDRPERSLRDLAAVFREDARYDGGAVVAEVDVYGPYRQVLGQMQKSIGVSIRGAGEAHQGEADGRTGTVFDRLVKSSSVDFVTKAGRGGQILQVLESARVVAETTANDTRELLQQALRDAYGGEKSYVWVRDFDDTTVWYWHETPDSEAIYALGYSIAADSAVQLDGTPEEVRATTTYVPVNPAGQSNTQESEEDSMATTQIEESDLARLREDAGRVLTLEAERDAARQERDTAITERDDAREAAAVHDRAVVVDRVLSEAREAANGIQLNTLETEGIAARRVLAENGTVDEAATRTAFDTALASLAESRGAGRPRGLGGGIPAPPDAQQAVTEAALDQLGDEVFGGGIVKEA